MLPDAPGGPHPFVSADHCKDCRREYNRNYRAPGGKGYKNYKRFRGKKAAARGGRP